MFPIACPTLYLEIKPDQALKARTGTHVPDSLLYAMLRVCSWDMVEIWNGTVPDRLFWLRSTSIKLQASKAPMEPKSLGGEAAPTSVLLMI